MISDQDIPALYRKLKPFIAKDRWQTGVTSQSTTGSPTVSAHALYGAAHTGTLDRSQAPWVASDIAAAINTHNTVGDPHSQYVHISNARTISASHNFAHATVGFTSPDADSYFDLGRARAGYVGHTDYAGFAHRGYANNEDYALAQNGATGAVAINAPLLATLALRNADVDVLRVSESLVEVANVSAATLRSENYASQTTGWSLTYGGALDVRYLYADEMHVKAFIADLEQALAGGQIICKSVAKLAVDFIVPNYSATTLITVESFPGWPNAYVFTNGDTIGIKIVSRTNGSSGTAGSLTVGWLFGTVSGASFDTTNKRQTWTLTRLSSSTINGFAAGGTASAGSTVEAGAIVLDFGVSGNGYYEVNAIDGQMAVNSPYMRIYTWNTHPIYDATVRSSVGNLTGLGFTSQYGLYARGSDANQYIVASGSGITVRNTSISQYDGSNNLTGQWTTSGMAFIGQNVAASKIRWTVGGVDTYDIGAFTGGDSYNRMDLRSWSATKSATRIGAWNTGQTNSPVAYVEVRQDTYASAIHMVADAVGVGTTAAGAKLHIVGDPSAPTNHYGQLIVNPNSDNQDCFISLRTTRSTDRTWLIGAGSGSGVADFRIRDYTAGADRLNINTAGKVGVGTDNPVYLLDVASRGRFRSGDGQSAGIWFSDGTPSDRAFIGLESDGASPVLGLFVAGDWRARVTSGGLFFVGNSTDIGFGSKIQTDGNFWANGAITSASYWQVAAASVPAAASGYCRVTLRSSDNALVAVMPSGNVRVLATN